MRARNRHDTTDFRDGLKIPGALELFARGRVNARLVEVDTADSIPVLVATFQSDQAR